MCACLVFQHCQAHIGGSDVQSVLYSKVNNLTVKYALLEYCGATTVECCCQTLSSHCGEYMQYSCDISAERLARTQLKAEMLVVMH